jgi:hypothetical protein
MIIASFRKKIQNFYTDILATFAISLDFSLQVSEQKIEPSSFDTQESQISICL